MRNLKKGGRKEERKRRKELRPLLTFRHRASCILGQSFRYSPENAFYVYLINKYISFSDICLTVYQGRKKKKERIRATVNLYAPCVLYIGQSFHYSPENAFYVYLINKCISFSDICLTVHY